MEENWNAQTCLSQQWDNLLETNVTQSESQCPPIWDGFLCWGPTSAGTTVSSRCPSFKGSDITKSAFRICSPSGEWLDRDGVPSPVGWTNYTPCLTPEIREIMRRLGSNDDAQMKFNIAANTRILEFVGLSLSLAALLLSLFIFYYFRTLRNSRTRLHRHLFIAMVIQVGIRLIVYTDQAITRSIEASTTASGGNSNLTSSYDSSGGPGGRGGESMTSQRSGIDNTPILCEASYISLEYARTAMFMWMFVEGLFLHNMITVTVFEEKLSPLVYPVIGWVLPIPLTVAWALVTHLHYGTATCWWGYNFTLYFWILEGPRLAVLMVNLAFLLNILRVLVMKLRQSNSSETQQALKAVKAALVLLPLLGLTNLLNMLDAPLEKSPFQFALWSYTTHLLTSTQGFILAFLYCFRNGEVQIAVRKFVRIRILGNSRRIILTKKPIPLSALDKESYPDPGDSRGGGSCSHSHSVDFVNLPTTTVGSPSPLIHQNGGVHYSNKSQNKNMIMKTFAAYSTPPTAPGPSPPSLIVRSYSNGVIKQTAVQQTRQHFLRHNDNTHNRNPYRNSSSCLAENQRLLRSQIGGGNGGSDGSKSFLSHQKRYQISQENPPTLTSTLSSSGDLGMHVPITSKMPMALLSPSSSIAKFTQNNSHSPSPTDEKHPSSTSSPSSETAELFECSSQNDNHTNTQQKKGSTRIKINQLASSWRMLIIPEQLLKRMRGGGGGGQQTVVDDDLVLSSLPKQQSVRQNNVATYACGADGVVVRDDDDDDEEGVEQETSTSTGCSGSGGGGEEEAAGENMDRSCSSNSISADFFSVDMMLSQDGDDDENVEQIVLMGQSDMKQLNRTNIRDPTSYNDDDDDDYGEECTGRVRSGLEILKV